MSTLTLIYLVFLHGGGPTEERVKIELPTIYECEAMRKQQSFLPAPASGRLFIGSYCEKH